MASRLGDLAFLIGAVIAVIALALLVVIGQRSIATASPSPSAVVEASFTPLPSISIAPVATSTPAATSSAPSPSAPPAATTAPPTTKPPLPSASR
jgi:hypothetical protein